MWMIKKILEGFDPHEIYSLLANCVIYVIIISAIIYILFQSNLITKFFNWLGKFCNVHKKYISMILLIIFLLSLVILGGINYKIKSLDESTRVNSEEKIVIIEIDDYWNMEKGINYFRSYGYSMENYRSVSDVISKYGFVASLGVTPYIFIEETRKNLDLSEDNEMVDYLNKLNEEGYELAMHGYNHCRNAYYCPKYEEVFFNVLQGKKDLENIFGISFVTYFPPGNSWTTEQYENVKKVGFKMIANTHVPRWYFDGEIIIGSKGYDPVYDWGWYAHEFKHTPYEDWIKEMEKTNIFVLQLHCNTFDSQEKLDDLDLFLKYLKENNIKVVTYKEAYNLLKEE